MNGFFARFLEWWRVLGGQLTILSALFYVAVALLLLIYYTIAKRFKFQWQLLLVASIVFYVANCPLRLFALQLIPVCVTYMAALYVGRASSTDNAHHAPSTTIEQKRRSLLTAFVVVLNVAFLVYFKERNFFVYSANLVRQVFHLPHFKPFKIAAPFGVSYIQLMLISYYLDCSWQLTAAEKNPFKFLTYVLFFPITTSGPVARFSQMQGELFCEKRFNYERFCFGLQRIVWGMFKKMVIADRIALVVKTVYSNEQYTGGVVLLGLLSFVFQMYFDFSGCMDIVLGVAELFGIRLPENFTQPFFSVSLSEVWRRWHMTLGFWVKDYVLYPILKSAPIQNLGSTLKARLGKKNRFAKLIPTWCGMFCVWFIVGFWHGGSFNYILGSGLFFFVMIAGGQALEPFFAWLVRILHINTQAKSYTWFLRLRTILLFGASVSFDRALSFGTGLRMWRRAFADFTPWILVDGTLFKIGLDAKDFFVLLFSVLIVALVEMLEQRLSEEKLLNPATGKTSVRRLVANQNLVFRWILYIALVCAVLIFGMYGPGYDAKSFIYEAF